MGYSRTLRPRSSAREAGDSVELCVAVGTVSTVVAVHQKLARLKIQGLEARARVRSRSGTIINTKGKLNL